LTQYSGYDRHITGEVLADWIGGIRKPRQVKVYKNPHTGKVVETKGGNHKTLKEWKAEQGAATVESLADQVILV